MATIKAIDLGDMQLERVDKDANLDILTISLSDSDDTDVYDFEGPVKLIRLQGIVTDAATTQTFVAAIDALIDGEQQPIDYISDNSGIGTIQVKVINLSYEFVSGNPEKVEYTFTLIQANDNG